MGNTCIRRKQCQVKNAHGLYVPKPTRTKRSHWTYQPRNNIKTVPLKIHCPRSPVLGGTFPNGNCGEMTPTLWQHQACRTTDYVDGRGYIYCACDQDGRCILDIRFQCGSDAEYHSFASYLDVVQANSTVII